MKKAISIMCLLIIVGCLTGCASNEKKLVGTWYSVDNESFRVVFYEDGTMKGYYGDVVSEKSNWSIENGKLKIDGQQMDYEISGDTLTVSAEGQTATYKKKS